MQFLTLYTLKSNDAIISLSQNHMSISKRISHIMYLFKVLLFQKLAVTLMIGRSVNSISSHLNFKLKFQRHPPKSSSLWDKSNSIINISNICFSPSEV